MSAKHGSHQDLNKTAEAVIGGDRVAIGRAITLIESAKPEDQALAQRLLEALLPRTGKAIRVGISGVPGAGKSTLIDQLGINLVAKGKKVAVLAVDPTSTRSGGSILGDKTRMGRLASEQGAFIRPSPAGDSLGGVTKTTRETIALVEAAGYEGTTTTEPGLASPDEPFTLARIRVDRGDGAAGLAHKLAQAGLTIGSTSRSLRAGPTRGNVRALRP